jgi:hypothetical protein
VPTKGVRDTAALDAVVGNIRGDPYWALPAPPSWLKASCEKPKRLRITIQFRKLDGNALHPDRDACPSCRLCAPHSIDR